MGLDDMARLFALLALGLPAIVFFRRLRKSSPAAAWRYLLGIAAMFVWSVAGVVVMASVLPERPDRIVTGAAILFLLGWIALAVVAFLTWGVPPHTIGASAKARLRFVATGIACATGLGGAILLAMA